nr:MAG TPA: hypothetical protein [Caudoviricetes sp.]
MNRDLFKYHHILFIKVCQVIALFNKKVPPT